MVYHNYEIRYQESRHHSIMCHETYFDILTIEASLTRVTNGWIDGQTE